MKSKNEDLVVLFPTPSFFPAQTGGPDNTCYWLTKALTKKGVTTLISSTDFGLPEDVARDEWLDRGYGSIIYTHNPIHYMPLKTIWKATKVLRKADILHLTMITYPAAWITALVNAFTYRLPVVWSSRGDLDTYMLKRSPRKKKFVIWLINNVIGTKNITFHSTCEAESGYIRAQFGDDARIIELTNYMDVPERVYAEKKKQLLFLGRIDAKKGIENLIQAIKASKKFQQSAYTLKVAGDYNHEYGLGLKKLVEDAGLSDTIEFLGHVAGEDKQRLLAESHFLIMPSHTENFGIVVTEALAQATPAVASTGTPWEVLNETRSGFWTDNDPATLQDVVERILDMPAEEYAEYQQNGLKLVHEGFSMDDNVHKWVTYYNKIK